jgi:hypothetical protein
MNAVPVELMSTNPMTDYVCDLNRLLEAALEAERSAEAEIGAISDFEPFTAAETYAFRSAVDRLVIAREWQEAINAQLSAIEESNQPCILRR